MHVVASTFQANFIKCLIILVFSYCAYAASGAILYLLPVMSLQHVLTYTVEVHAQSADKASIVVLYGDGRR